MSVECAAPCSRVQCENMTTKERLTVNLEATDFRELQRMARKHNVSLAWLGRLAIERFLEQCNSQRELPFLFPSDNRLEP